MKTQTAISSIKTAVHDISDEYSVQECLSFLNTAIHTVSGFLIAARMPFMVHEIKLHDGENVPIGYVASAGIYPIRITGQKVSFHDKSLPEIRFRYFRSMTPLPDAQGDMPFAYDALNDYVLKIAILYALNHNEYDITQDKALADELRQVLVEAVTAHG